jgi:RNA polymerase sigma factor (sigma-70 family)
MTRIIEEEKLLKLLAAGDISAIEFLYDHYASSIYGFIIININDVKISEEILIETMYKIWKSFPQYDSSKNRFFNWMINICREIVIEKMRSKKLSFQNNNQDIERNVLSSNSITNKNNVPEINEMKKKLEPEYYRVIDLLFINGNSQSEVAEKLNIPLGTVKTRSHAAIQKLKMLFQ